MRTRRGDYERIRSVLKQADPEEPLTAREILRVLKDHGEEFDSVHRVATVLGRRAETDEVEVIRDQPYRYFFADGNN
ncbi:MAG: putative Zn-ribbon and HTH transcriptional regulator [Natronomonas sp.]|jgi:predicted Zn-ribbon and HTH transcriptional regulator